MMPADVADRIDYYFEVMKIADEKSDYAEFMEKWRDYKPPSHLGVRSKRRRNDGTNRL